MTRPLAAILVSALSALAASPALAQLPRKGPTTECVFNSDCPSPLVCQGTFCRAQCMTDRDCGPGQRCQSPNKQDFTKNYCELAAQAPSVAGYVFGRVEESPGVPATACEAEVVSTHTRVACDTNGEFMISSVPAGYQRITVRSRAAGTVGQERTVGVWVDPQAHASTGPVVLKSAISTPTSHGSALQPKVK